MRQLDQVFDRRPGVTWGLALALIWTTVATDLHAQGAAVGVQGCVGLMAPGTYCGTKKEDDKAAEIPHVDFTPDGGPPDNRPITREQCYLESTDNRVVKDGLGNLRCVPKYCAASGQLVVLGAGSDCAGRPIRTSTYGDPNDKAGSLGVTGASFVAGGTPLRYAIFFENLETFTAAVPEVVITDPLDVDRMDLDTLSLGPISFGAVTLLPLPGQSEYASDVDFRPEKNMILKIRAQLDKTSGVLTWRFTATDPVTRLLTDDPLAGFLPPNKIPPEGEGSVLFTVKPKASLPTGAEIRNMARIVFDVNPPIDTPQWLNTIDSDKPTSQVAPLAPIQSSAAFPVAWSGTDGGAGIRDYTIFVSEDGGPFIAWLSNTPETSATFSGESGKTYAFYSVARDLVANAEDAPTTPDTSTQVSAGGGSQPDTTPPLVTLAVIAGTLGNDHWYRSDITVHTNGTDAGSGIASCTADQTLTTDTAGAVVTGSCTDNAGNVGHAAPLTLKRDATPPETVGKSDVMGTQGTVTLTATDHLSGITATSYNINGGASQSYTGPFVLNGAGAYMISFFSADVAGNVEPPKTLNVDIAASPGVDVCLNSNVLDNFNRTNGALGSNWGGVTSTAFYRISDNRLDVQSGGPVFWKAQTFGMSQTATVTLSAIDARSPAQGLLLKAQGGSVPDTGAISVVYDARAKAVRVSTFRLGALDWTPYGHTPAIVNAGDRLSACAKANGEVRVYRNDTLMTTVTLNATDQAFFNSRGGKIGLWSVLAPNAFFDDFGGGSVAP